VATDPITLDFSGSDEIPTGVSLLTLTDAISGSDVSTAAGLTLPVAFTAAGGGVFTRTFTDTGASIYGFTYRLTWADATTSDLTGTVPGANALTSRAAIEATGKVNADVWADINSDDVDAEITAQFDRVVAEAQQAARETADEAGALALYPLASTDAQYYALQRAATDFALARLQQMRPEPVAAGKVPIGVTGEQVARQKMLDVWQTVQLREDTATTSAPVAEVVTLYPRHSGCFPAFGPVCG
jgi:hypothetical protein